MKKVVICMMIFYHVTNHSMQSRKLTRLTPAVSQALRNDCSKKIFPAAVYQPRVSQQTPEVSSSQNFKEGSKQGSSTQSSWRKPLFLGGAVSTLGGLAYMQNTKKEVRADSAEEKIYLSDRNPFGMAAELPFWGAYLDNVGDVNFARVYKNGKFQFIPVAGPFRDANDERYYMLYNGSVEEVLFKLADRNPEIIRILLNNVESPVNTEVFLKLVLSKDAQNIPLIYRLNTDNLLNVLDIIKKRNTPFNLNEKISENQTLFTLWLENMPSYELLEKLLEFDPTLIKQLKNRPKSFLAETFLIRSEKFVELILKSMAQQDVSLSNEELWLKRAYFNELSFFDERFVQLNQELKVKIYFLANRLAHEDLITKLKSLGMAEEPIYLPGPSIIPINADAITEKNIIKDFFLSLRKAKLLLTHEEFNRLDQEKYFKKSNQIGRILGRDFIEKITQDFNLKHIKVPKKIIVINNKVEKLVVSVMGDMDIEPFKNYSIKEDALFEQVTIYAEEILPVKRNISLEEAIEFMIVVEKTGYKDFTGDNIFVAADGIYFIDTEFENFNPVNPPFDRIKNWVVSHLANENDIEKFSKEYERRKQNFEKEKKKLEDRRSKIKEMPRYEKMAQWRTFTFPVEDLLKTHCKNASM